MAKDTGAVGRAALHNKTLRKEILKAVSRRKTGLTCYELEDRLARTHQTVSGTITYMVRDGLLDIAPFTRKNQFGNEVRVYLAGSSV